jgi:pimeloyl-ACP methyl ester carboxylesterase
MSNHFLERPSVSRTWFRRCRLVLLALLCLTVAAIPGRGDVVILKDGYAIHGKILEEKSAIIDNLTGMQLETRKAYGLTLMDDGPRYTIFSAHYKRVGDVSTVNKFVEHVTITRQARNKHDLNKLPSQMEFDRDKSKTEFNSRWQRTLVFRNTAGPGFYEIEQQIDILTPHYVRIVSITHDWRSYYLTREWRPETIRKLISQHPDFMEPKGPDVDKRAKLIRFLIQADWLSEAEEEIDRLALDLPGETKRADEFREEIRTIRLEAQIAEIERAKEGGRHIFALSALRQIPKNKVPAKMVLRVAGLKAEYEAAAEKLEKARRYLKGLQVQAAKSKAEFILDELHLDTASRLDLFIALAEQAETAAKENRVPLHKPQELLAAAVTGWLMGNNSTETNLVTAYKRLKARDMALSYLRTDSGIKRREILKDYEQDADALPFDELDKLISLLPPPNAETDLSKGPVEKKTAQGMNYLVQLPPEYQHGRPYPLLLVLPKGGERMAAALNKLGDLPGKNGYIVAAVDWNDNGTKNTYDYTEAEHATVTNLLRHLRRTLQVDSDRVFLFGYREGATMALDVAASHPDIFAGVVPMGPTPEKVYVQVFEYWKNFQNLPVYMVAGDHVGDASKIIRNLLQSWMLKGYPAVAVTYKGRSTEYFTAELPNIFDWMGRKSRALAVPNLGRTGEEFRTVRSSGNRFYWISLDDIDPARLYDPARKASTFTAVPKIDAHIVEGNQINVNAFGMSQISIWLGKGMVDFAKPVAVKIGSGGNKVFKKELTPKISVLLEDLYERGDRQRPYYQRIDCTNLNKLTKFAAQ